MSEPMTDENLDELEAIHAKCVAEHTHAPSRFCLFADHARIIFPRLLAEVKRLRAAEQPPTPPSGRGEERERLDEIREDFGFHLANLERNDYRMTDRDKIVRDLIAAVDSRDAVIAALVDAAWYARTWRWDDPDGLPKDACQKIDAALLAARPFTKEPR